MQPDDLNSYSREELIEYVEALEQILSGAVDQLEVQYNKGFEDAVEESLIYFAGTPLKVQ